MRRIIIIAVLVIALIGGAGLCVSKVQIGGTAGPGKNPEATVKAAIMAMEKMDPAKVTPCFTPIPGASMANRLATLYSKVDSIDIQDLKCMLVLDEGVAARVQATYNMVFAQGGYVNTERCNKTIKLIKLDGKWYINEPF